MGPIGNEGVPKNLDAKALAELAAQQRDTESWVDIATTIVKKKIEEGCPEQICKELPKVEATSGLGAEEINQLVRNVKDSINEPDQKKVYRQLVLGMLENFPLDYLVDLAVSGKIEEEKIRAEIAKLAAQQDGRETSASIKNYEITDEKALFKIAKLCVQQDGWWTSYNIRAFGITDEKALIKIAKLAAQQDAGWTSSNIQEYGFSKQKNLIEVAKFCAQQDGWGTSSNIQEYGIEDPLERIEIFYIAFAQSYESIKLINNYILNADMPPLIKDIQAIFAKPTPDYEMFKRSLAQFFKSKKLEITPILEQIDKQKNEVSKREQAVWLITTFIQLRSITDEQAQWIAEKNFLPEIFNLRNPALRYGLSKLLPNLAAEGASQFEELQKGMSPHALLTNMILASLETDGVNPEIIHAMNLRLKGKTFKDKIKINILLTTLLQLKENSNLTPKQKSTVLNRMENEKDLIRQCIFLQGILELHGEDKLMKMRPFEELLKELFMSKVPIGELKDFADKYSNTLALFRRPETVMAYAGKLSTLPDRDHLLRLYGIYIRSVLEGNSREIRSQTDSNPHLAKIKETDLMLFNKWMKGFTRPLESLLSSENPTKKEPQIDFLKILENKVLNDKHIDPDTVPYLKRFLEKPDEKTEITKALGKAISTAKKASENERALLFIQSYCIKLASGQEPKKSLGSLVEMLNKIDKHTRPEEFFNDIKVLHAAVFEQQNKKEKNTYQGWTMENSDDPCDLLLCGTEVAGSCQRVNGKPELNKCLISYLLDGKNRLLAIKDPSGNIEARTMLRLLWDSEKGTPVLFQERIYPEFLQGELAQALLEEGKKIAEELGVPFARKGMPYPRSLHALGGPVPWEYSDAAKGVQPNGRYTINEAMMKA